MKKMIWQSVAAIGLMAVAYYLYNPQKYNRKAKQLKSGAAKFLETS